MGRHRKSVLRWVVVRICLAAVVGIGVELAVLVPSPAHSAPRTVSPAQRGAAAGQQGPSGTLASFSRNWLQYGFSPQHTGYNPYELAIGVSNVSKLTVAWSDTTQKASSAAFAVLNGVAYTETNDGTFYALSGATGAILWRAAIGSTISDPAVANGMVYFSAADGYLYAFNAAGCGAATCTWQWRTSLQEFMQVTPTVVNGVIYIATTNGSHVAAYTATNGTLIWSTPISTTGDTFSSAPTVANNIVYVGGAALYTFSASTGSSLWTGSSSDGFIGYAPVVVQNGVAYANTGNGHLYAFNATGCGSATCSALWMGSAGTFISNQPAVAYGMVYVTGSATLYAFSAAGCGSATCSAAWTSPMSHCSCEYATGAPSVANGVVYYGSNYGTLYAVGAAGCGGLQCPPILAYQVGGLVETPVVVSGMVYVGIFNYSANTDEKFYAFSVPGTH